MKYRELLKEAEVFLEGKGVADYRTDAWLLFEYSFSMTRAAFLMKCTEEISSDDEGKCLIFRERLEKRGQRIPLQRITGSQEFMGLPFFVNEWVLIPRQDTEVLAEEAIAAGKGMLKNGPIRILDLCTGSGCIGISVSHELRKYGEVKTILSDISKEALAVADRNRRENGVEDICSCRESDLFENITGEQFELLLSNPPYIPSDVIEELQPEVRDHEPRLALDGMADGVYYYRRIAEEAGAYLTPGGKLFFEIGYDQSAAVEELLRAAGFDEVRTIRDLAGLDRVVTGTKTGN